MKAAFRYLKWNDAVVGLVARDFSVQFIEPRFNTAVGLYTHGQTSWSPEQFLQFLSERIMSPSRRDIERLLFRCGLSEYDTFKIADVTHAINPRDELWMAHNAEDRMTDTATEVFDTIFLQCIDAVGDSVDTPEGANVKRYGASHGAYGIVKQRISPLSTDVESEVAAALLAKALDVPCCRAWRFDDSAVFSAFEYDFTCEHLVHMRRLFDGPRGENELENLLAVRPQYADDFYRMIAFDFIMRQDDRHLSNIAVLVTEQGESFYPLYDNGRSLFYEDTEEFARKAATDPRAFATTFGYAGTYWDHACDIAVKGVRFGDLLNLDLDACAIRSLLAEAGFTDYRLEAATEWVANALALLQGLDS
ncbi:hypothetical protein VJ923_02405 [Adlercreutzia sp. R25]|uniref:HipA-like C-terminal domain-containing protein n=1 Tax=Adlercreutzia shanghongiae TaxID=3111773 RepID=A0ABU6IV95_9ACTN|nr:MULTISPECIES: hypothetical protein [unclassified Adlercreutzia]MEC4272013.1 hypothetical protein [Adlercreutzia sp. R25]MEC4293744.1 hypothetical protein [Adlercreutzia sp. R22]